MDLRKWQQLYVRAERAARAFFAEHFSDLCANCFQASQQWRDPAFLCCRRTNFVPEIITDPLLGDLAEDSLGHSLLPLSGIHNQSGCAALGSEGCRIPFGRTDVCNSYVCEHQYRSASVALPPGSLYRIQEALEVFSLIRLASRRDDAAFRECEQKVAEVEQMLTDAADSLRANAEAFARRKAEVAREMYPPAPPR